MDVGSRDAWLGEPRRGFLGTWGTCKKFWDAGTPESAVTGAQERQTPRNLLYRSRPSLSAVATRSVSPAAQSLYRAQSPTTAEAPHGM